MGASVGLAFLLLVTALATVPLGRRLTGDYFSPAALVVTTWAATLGLFFLHVIPYADIRPATMLFVLAATATLVAMAQVGRRLFVNRKGPAVAPAAAEACVAAMAMLGLVGTAWYVWTVADVLGASAFFDRPWRIRFALGDRSVPSRYLILQFLCVATPILAVALALTGHRLRRGVWLLVFACLAGTAISTDRTEFFVVALTVYFMYILQAGRRLSLAALTVRSAAVLVTLAAYFLLIGAWMGKTPGNLNVDVQVPTLSVTASPRRSQEAKSGGAAETVPRWRSELQQRLRGVSTLYLYATASYAALDVLLENPQPRTNGLHTAYPVARFLERTGVITGLPAAIAPFVPLGLTSGSDVSYNTYTFLYYPVTDFGPFGGVAYAAGIGLLSGLVYGRYRLDRRSTFWLLTMGHLSAALVLTVFVNKFNNTASWYIYLWTCVPFILSRLFPQWAADPAPSGRVLDGEASVP